MSTEPIKPREPSGQDVVQCSVTLNQERTGVCQTFILGIGECLKLGRHPENDFRVDFEGVSSCHAELSLNQGDIRQDPIVILDRSKNGTAFRPGPTVKDHWMMGIAPKWEPLQRGGKRVLLHDSELLMPLKAEGSRKSWTLRVQVSSRLTLADVQDLDGEPCKGEELAAARAGPKRPRPTGPPLGGPGPPPPRVSAAPPAQVSAAPRKPVVAPRQDSPPRQPRNSPPPRPGDAPPLPPGGEPAPSPELAAPPTMGNAMEEMMARCQAFANAKARENHEQAPPPMDDAPPPPADSPPPPPDEPPGGPPPLPPEPPGGPPAPAEDSDFDRLDKEMGKGKEKDILGKDKGRRERSRSRKDNKKRSRSRSRRRERSRSRRRR